MPHLLQSPPSAIQQLVSRHPPPQESHTDQTQQAHYLALQIAHNLRFQHRWKDIKLHHRIAGQVLPRPVISGLPPQRLYVHPDEQVELIQQQRKKGVTGLPQLAGEYEWVVPSRVQERWSLKRFAHVFDALSIVPPDGTGVPLFDVEIRTMPEMEVTGSASQDAPAMETRKLSTWRTSQPKRLLLATADDDSTIVYYIVHDGIVKPRQN